MPRNIEIQVEDHIYERLKMESAKYDMDVEKYIPVMIEKHNLGSKENYQNYIEEKVKKPLKKILQDLEGFSGNPSESSAYNKIFLLPLKIYAKALPKGFNRILEYYKNKGWYHIDHFYLITDEKGILGYLGLNILEEDAPYGKYLLIYGVNLYKEYQNSPNLNYIINFIKSIGRKNQCYSIDILFENGNLTYEHLKRLGFQIFSSVDMVSLKNIKEGKDGAVDLYSKRKIENMEEIQGFIPVARTEPIEPLYNYWKARKDKIETVHMIYEANGEEIVFIYVKEEKAMNNKVYDYFTLLVDPKFVYDDGYIGKAIDILASLESGEEDGRNEEIISIPRELNKNLSIYGEHQILDSFTWLRKNNS